MDLTSDQISDTIFKRLNEENMLIQIIEGSNRLQIIEHIYKNYQNLCAYYSAIYTDLDLINVCNIWRKAEALSKYTTSPYLIIINDIHKIKNWPSVIKGLWDSRITNIKVIIAGEYGFLNFLTHTESLCGRYELLKIMQ